MVNISQYILASSHHIVHLKLTQCCFLTIIVFIYLWLCWVFVAARAFLVVESRGYSLAVHRLLSAVSPLAVEHGLLTRGLSCGVAWALEHRHSSRGTRA